MVNGIQTIRQHFQPSVRDASGRKLRIKKEKLKKDVEDRGLRLKEGRRHIN
jgi:hypothetical protein